MNTLYLIRGLPNTGKTRLAGELANRTVAADDFQVDERGEYDFVQRRAAFCDQKCRLRVAEWIIEGVGRIAVHNTFAQNWEMEPYVEMAREGGYRIVVITVERSHDGDNGHGVAPKTITAMRDRWEGFDNGLLQRS